MLSRPGRRAPGRRAAPAGGARPRGRPRAGPSGPASRSASARRPRRRGRRRARPTAGAADHPAVGERDRAARRAPRALRVVGERREGVVQARPSRRRRRPGAPRRRPPASAISTPSARACASRPVGRTTSAADPRPSAARAPRVVTDRARERDGPLGATSARPSSAGARAATSSGVRDSRSTIRSRRAPSSAPAARPVGTSASGVVPGGRAAVRQARVDVGGVVEDGVGERARRPRAGGTGRAGRSRRAARARCTARRSASARAPPAPRRAGSAAGSAHVTRHVRAARSSTGRSASSASGSSPSAVATRPALRDVREPPDGRRCRPRPGSRPGPAARAAAGRRRRAERADLVGGDLVAQLQHHRGVVAGRRAALGREREPERGQGPVAAADLVGERRVVAPTSASSSAVSRAEKRTPPVVESTEISSDTARTAAKPTPNRPTARRVRRRAWPTPASTTATRRRPRRAGAPVFAATRTSRSPVRAGEPQQQPARDAGARGGVGGVLRELDDHAVAVVAAGVVLLGVGVLPQPRRGDAATPPGRPRAGRPSRRRRRSRLRVGAGRGSSAGRRGRVVRWRRGPGRRSAPGLAGASSGPASSSGLDGLGLVGLGRRRRVVGRRPSVGGLVGGPRRRRRRSGLVDGASSVVDLVGRRPRRSRPSSGSRRSASGSSAPRAGQLDQLEARARRSAGRAAGQSVGGASASVSECAPQPWSRLTTVPSSGDHSLAQTPKTVPSEPCSGTRNPQLPHAAAEASEPALVGPCGPRYQRSAASSRPCGESTRTRARASSSIATSSSSGSPVGVQPGSSRGSSALNGSTSPGPMSPGRMRSDHGSQAWPRTASGPGSSSASQTVAVRPRGTRATVTVHSQPR